MIYSSFDENLDRFQRFRFDIELVWYQSFTIEVHFWSLTSLVMRISTLGAYIEITAHLWWYVLSSNPIWVSRIIKCGGGDSANLRKQTLYFRIIECEK